MPALVTKRICTAPWPVASAVLPQILVQILVTPLTQALVGAFASRGHVEARRGAWVLASVALGGFGVLGLLLLVSAPFWLRALAPGFDTAQLLLARRLLLPLIMAFALNAVFAVVWSCAFARRPHPFADRAP